MLSAFERWSAVLVNGIGRAACWLLVPLMLLIVFDVVGRRFLSLPTVLLQELEWYLHGVLLLLTLGYGYLTNVHVRIDVLADHFPESARLIIEIAGVVLFVIPYLGLLIYLSVDFAWVAFESHEASSAAQGLSERWIIKAFLPVGFFITLLSGVLVAIAAYRRLVDAAAEPRGGATP